MYSLNEISYQIVIFWYLICPKLFMIFFWSRAPAYKLYLYKHSELLYSQNITGISCKRLQQV